MLIVAMVILVASAILMVPVTSCDNCGGDGQVEWDETERIYVTPCNVCSGRGKVPLLNIWSKEAE